MKWYVAKMVYRIICGNGNHTAQFDEQLRLIAAGSEGEAFEKACTMGREEQESFLNQKNELVHWQFVNVPELYCLSRLIDGAEIYSRINEVDDAEGYTAFVNRKAEFIGERQTDPLPNLI